MNTSKRLRRTALLSLHCLSNLAYFRAVREGVDIGEVPASDVNNRIANNFLDVGVLEWCKLFTDRAGKHHWRKVVSANEDDRTAWRDALVVHLGLTLLAFEDYIRAMKTYRDRFVAHLDDDEVMEIPDLDLAIRSAQCLYQRLVDHEAPLLGNPMPEAPESATDFYQDRLGKGQAAVAAMRAGYAA